MNAWEIKSGHMAFHVMADKCLDISDLSYKGMNMSFMAKPGLMGRCLLYTSGRKGGRPGKAPDDQGVDGMVELLEHIAGYEGQGQEHELGSDIA